PPGGAPRPVDRRRTRSGPRRVGARTRSIATDAPFSDRAPAPGTLPARRTVAFVCPAETAADPLALYPGIGAPVTVWKSQGVWPVVVEVVGTITPVGTPRLQSNDHTWAVLGGA